MEAGKRSLNDIFNRNKILEIPFFQRAYVWDEPQWQRFLADMEYLSLTNKPYFLGSIILKQQLTNSQQSIGDKRTIIDGQQRLTTLAIFFKVLSLKLKNQYINDIFRLPLNNNEIALMHNRNDIDAFTRILNLSEMDHLEELDNITRSYKYFVDNIDENKINVQNILTNLMFVGIDLNTNDDEQQIFDTINSLGVKLTTAELLKNYFFDRNDIDKYIVYWQNVFEKDIEIRDYWETEIFAGRLPRTFIDILFYSFLQIKIQEPGLQVRAEDKNSYGKVDSLFESYKNFIEKYKIDKNALLCEIKEYANIFSNNLNNNAIDCELGSHGIDRINVIIFGLETTTLIPYILYLLKNQPDKNEKNKIYDTLESYIIRRMVVHANTKNYNQLFTERFINNKILTAQEIVTYINDRSDKVNYFPTDQELVDGFKTSKLINKQALGILYMIETKIRNRSMYTTSIMGIDRYSLEHIMPKKWKNNWNDISSEIDVIERDRKLLTLGNLTMITSSLNSSIRDASWEVKKNGNEIHEGLKHFASGLETFSEYLKEPKWDETTIERRAEFLSQKALQIWQW